MSKINVDGAWYDISGVRVLVDTNLWTQHTMTGFTGNVDLMAAVDATHVWSTHNGFIGKINFWNGTSSVVQKDVSRDGYETTITYLFALDTSNVWAIVSYYNRDTEDYYTSLWKYNGSSWTETIAPAGEFYTAFFALSLNDMWLASSVGVAGDGVIKHWDGNSWSEVWTGDSDVRGYIVTVYITGTSADNIWTSNYDDNIGFTLRFDGENWTETEVPNYGLFPTLSIVGEDSVWTFDYYSDSDLYHWENDTWTLVDSNAEYGIADIFAVDDEHVYVTSLYVSCWDGERWNWHILSEGDSTYAIRFISDSVGFVGGTNGTIYTGFAPTKYWTQTGNTQFLDINVDGNWIMTA